eukprot:scaffold60216_cov37-Phaeocystis_antarctica.AAC.1
MCAKRNGAAWIHAGLEPGSSSGPSRQSGLSDRSGMRAWDCSYPLERPTRTRSLDSEGRGPENCMLFYSEYPAAPGARLLSRATSRLSGPGSRGTTGARSLQLDRMRPHTKGRAS